MLPKRSGILVLGQTSENMKALFTLGADEFGDRYAKKQEVYELVQKNQDSVFEWLDINTRSGQTTLGKALCKFAGRELNGIRLNMPLAGKNDLRYQFQRLPERPTTTAAERISGMFSRPSYSETKKSEDAKQGEKEGEDFTGCTDSSRENIPDIPVIPGLTIHREEQLGGGKRGGGGKGRPAEIEKRMH